MKTLSKSVQHTCSCFLTDEQRLQKNKSKLIDRDLALEKRRLRRTQKIVLLGVGESGKSTFLKQIQIIHGKGFDDEAKRDFRTKIYENIINGLSGLANGKRELKLPWFRSDSLRIFKEFVQVYQILMVNREKKEKELGIRIDILPEEFVQVVPLINELWNEEGMQLAYERRREFPRFFVENIPYYVSQLSRISKLDYLPDSLDILRCRRATTGIIEVDIEIKNVPFLFVDVGGQRTQRQKWHQCFSDVTAILFLVSTSEFDEYLREDFTVNRLEESMRVFETLVNYRFLRNVEFILFLNKHDLLREKVKRTNIKNYCDDFDGDPHSLEQVENYLQLKFQNLKHHDPTVDSQMYSTSIYSHFTTAIDTNNIKTIFESVRQMIFEKNCKAIMLQ